MSLGVWPTACSTLHHKMQLYIFNDVSAYKPITGLLYFINQQNKHVILFDTPSQDYTPEGMLGSQGEVQLGGLSRGGVPLQVLEEERGRGDVIGNCTGP